MKPINVSQLNRYIKTILHNDPLLSNISVTGEISNLKYHGTGHVYFSLKDEGGRINCFLPSERVKNLRYTLEEGMQIIASGYIYLYEKGGSYSLNILDISVEGEGNLAIAFEKLKQKLIKEGLFDEQYKKPLPFFPKTVAIITSDTGAAVWDMIRTIKNKNNYVNILLCPCLVQGDAAAADIEKAINAVNRTVPKPEVIILGRGGGSGEDLWAFNEERVARSIFASEIPVISAVGHETDFSIADFAADYRAATPTAAAEAAVPDIQALLIQLKDMFAALTLSLNKKIEFIELSLENCSPEKLCISLNNKVHNYDNKLEKTINSVLLSFKEVLHREEMRIEKIKSSVDSLNPSKIMELGYGAISDSSGKLIKSVLSIQPGDKFAVRLADGNIDCTAEAVQQF